MNRTDKAKKKYQLILINFLFVFSHIASFAGSGHSHGHEASISKEKAESIALRSVGNLILKGKIENIGKLAQSKHLKSNSINLVQNGWLL